VAVTLGRRHGIAGRIAAVAVILVLAAVGVGRAQPAAPAVAVRSVVPDAKTDTLTIEGEHFGPSPFVTLDLVPLDVRLALDTQIMVSVPLEQLPPARYLLTVSRGAAAHERASIEVPLGLPADPPLIPPLASAIARSRWPKPIASGRPPIPAATWR
jgi:hypothetical protein